MLTTLPFLDGIKLLREGDHLQPIPGMNVVADLLATARNEAPHLYETWRVVSLARLESDGELEVRASNVEKIVFTARSSTDFLRQIAQLDVLIDSVQAQISQPVKEINLSIGRMTDGRIQVPVSFKEPLVTNGVAPRREEPITNRYFKPNQSTKREL